MDNYYTAEKSIQMLISLMKAHEVKKVIASPGSTNISFVMSIQRDGYFEMYSAPDERSAAYMACGLAAESKEPVALSCTGATASRNYVPGLTEAYYRKLPVLAITSTQHMGQVGQYVPQVIDRSQTMNDIVNLSVQVPMIHDAMDAWSTNVKLNTALLELRHRGGGPVHINLMTSYPFYPNDFSVKQLPPTRVMHRVEWGDQLPEIRKKRVAIFVGNHVEWDKNLTDAVSKFCMAYNAVVLCDLTSNYQGECGISASLATSQDMYRPECTNIELGIHIGEVSGAYLSINPNEVWRVSPDGVIRDTFRKLTYTFEMSELEFFERYNKIAKEKHNDSYFQEWVKESDDLYAKIEELPFSNIWVAQKTLDKLPSNSYLFLGILNSLRAWNFFRLRKDIVGYSNTGGFGIDGGMSSLVGASLANPGKLHFGVFGDLGFFYDMNVLGNRHIKNNIRILLLNNGKGTEFRNYTHFASEFGEDADNFIAAGGHYGNKSVNLVKHYAEDMGFEYLVASNKEEYLKAMERFIEPGLTDKPMVFEVFTTNEQENEALKAIRNLEASNTARAKQAVKGVLGDKGVSVLKKIIGKS